MSKQKIPKSNKEVSITSQTQENLTKSITDFKQLIKNIRLALPKQARRMDLICNCLKNPTLISYLQESNPSIKDSKLLDFQQYTEYKELICEQSGKRFQQLTNSIQKLFLEFKKASTKALSKKEIFSVTEFQKIFGELKTKFVKIWKQEYFLLLNYRMDINAKQIQRWSILAMNKMNKEKIEQQINKLFN